MANDIDKTSPHYKGEFGSIYEVNQKFPSGGVEGDYVAIDGWAHYWNANRGTWCVNAQRDSYWDELITGIINKLKLFKGATYMGVADVSTIPEKIAGVKMYYFAKAAGTYSGFGGLQLAQGINVLYTDNGTSWTATPLLEVAQELGVSTEKVMSQKAVNTELDKKADKAAMDVELDKKADKSAVDVELGKKADKSAVDTELGKKFDKESVVQEFGDSEELVMSQKAVSTELSNLSKLSNEAIDGKYTITDFNNYSWNGSIVNIDSKYKSIKIPVTKGKKYTFESEGGAIQTTIKLSGNIVVGTNTGFIGYYRGEEVDSETKFLLVTFNNDTISATVKVDSSVREQLSLLDTNIANVDAKATANKSQLNLLVQESPNLFDASKNVEPNVFWGYQQQGTLVEENKYFVTYKIPVEKSTEYSINFLPTALGKNFAINYYTENDRYNGGSADTTFITGDATTYIRFCVTISMYSLEEFNNSFMLVKGDSSKIPSKYVKYGENVIGEVLEENISSKMKESLQEANNYTDSVVGRKREVHFSSKNIPIISLVYDDNSSNDDTLVKLADERGLKVTFSTIGSTNGFDSLGNKLKDWIVKGHGVISHGCTTGKDMIGINGKPFTVGDSMRFNCDKDAIKMMEGNISALDRYGLPHNGIAYFNQWDSNSPRLRNLVTSYYQYGITLSGDGTNDTSADIFNLKRYTTDNNTMLEGAKQLIDSAINNNVWLIFGGHMDRTATGSGNYSTMPDFIELLDYISKKVKSGQLISLNTDEAFFEFQSRKLVQNVIPNFEVDNSVTVGALRIKEGVVKVCTNSGTNAIYELIISGTPTEGTITIGIDNGNDKKDYTFNITSSMSLNDILILVQTALVSMSNNNQTYNIISNSNNHLTFSRAIKGECELPTINAGTTGLTLLFKEIKKGVNTTFN